jgi:3-phosphoshikimate 1-carboxyvinyltransferase
MAMSFAMAGLVVPGIVIDEETCVGKSFPDFWKVLQSMGVAFGP